MRIKLTSLFFILFISVFSQDLPPIVNYAPNIYGAGNQNWMISQDKNQFLFFANNEGLLEFNGSYWKLYPSPNETIIRSVKVIGDRIYTGSYMEFGFWKRKADGLLAYHSLSKLVESKFLDDENIWNILNYDNWVVFQSPHRIFIYDVNKGSFKIIVSHDYIFKSYKTANAIYYQTSNQGFYEIEYGKSKLISTYPVLKNNNIVNIFEKGDKLLLSTQSKGFYELSGNVLTKFPTEIDKDFSEGSVYSCEALSNGGFVVGTVSNGIFILTKDGKKKYHITQGKGLSNNTALSLFEDLDLHTQHSHGNTVNTKKTKVETIEQGFHLYAIDWNPDKIDFYVDNKLVYTFSPEDKTEAVWPFNQPFYFLINLAVGGNFGGPEVDDAIFPQEFKIDYIKVYQ